MSSIITLAWISGSIFFSTSIIMVNKYLMTAYQYHSPMFLTSFHFFLTWSLLEFMCRIGLIQRAKNVSRFDRWLLGAIGIVAVVFQNLNLMYNSIGFYQLSKLCSIPFMVAYNFFVEGKTTKPNILFSLVFLLIGVALFTVNDFSVNVIGTIMAIVAITTGSLTQLYTKTFQVKYAINGPTLQHQSALPSCVCCLVASSFVETHGPNSIFTVDFVPMTFVLILCSGILAVGTNACAFGLIGKTSAITFQVVGHIKTMLIFTFGLIIFRGENESTKTLMKKVFGLGVAMFGVILYTYFEIKNKQQEEREIPPPTDLESLKQGSDFENAAEHNEEDEDSL